MRRPPSEEAAPQWPSSAAALAVMDRLAALEATWHADHSLAQTVFTCLYLLHPQRCAPMHAGARATTGLECSNKFVQPSEHCVPFCSACNRLMAMLF